METQAVCFSHRFTPHKPPYRLKEKAISMESRGSKRPHKHGAVSRLKQSCRSRHISQKRGVGTEQIYFKDSFLIQSQRELHKCPDWGISTAIFCPCCWPLSTSNSKFSSLLNRSSQGKETIIWQKNEWVFFLKISYK